MKKRNKYGLNGLLIGAAGGAIYSVVKQKPSLVMGKPFDWQALARNTACGALIGGSGGYVLGAVKDYYNAREKRIDTDSVLTRRVDELVLKKSDPSYRFLRDKADQLSVFLQRVYHSDLVSAPRFYGSTEKGIALAKDFDIDLGVPFHASRYSTRSMYDDLKETVETFAAKHAGAKIRLQDKSIGILFPYRSSHFKIDVVPLRVSDEHISKTVGYLFVNSESVFSNPSRTKTDLNASLSLRLNDAQKKLMVLLKEWKRENDLSLSTYLLQTLVSDAYWQNRGRVPASFTGKLMMVVKHMETSIDKYHFYGRENTNNCLTDFSVSERCAITNACRIVITDFAYQPNNIIKHF